MSNVWGLDVQQVRDLATNLDREADSIDQILSKLTGILSNTQWTGPDATQFRNDWQSQHATSLRKVAEALRTVSSQARANASAQEQTSSN
jgi:uncharacterized protein YukE